MIVSSGVALPPHTPSLTTDQPLPFLPIEDVGARRFRAQPPGCDGRVKLIGASAGRPPGWTSAREASSWRRRALGVTRWGSASRWPMALQPTVRGAEHFELFPDTPAQVKVEAASELPRAPADFESAGEPRPVDDRCGRVRLTIPVHVARPAQ